MPPVINKPHATENIHWSLLIISTESSPMCETATDSDVLGIEWGMGNSVSRMELIPRDRDNNSARNPWRYNGIFYNPTTKTKHS